ncbi:MAG TPA: protein norD, partial [Rhizobiales bacterium]|nr:protein norD [Hyphomicrobiales bacterium]
MTGLASLFEPEELFGSFWHRLIGDVGKEPHFPEAGVGLKDIRRRLEIFFRALGGKPGVELKAIAARSVDYRQKLLARIGHGSTAIAHARFDGDHLFLPETIDLLGERQLNEKLYKWLVAWAAVLGDDSPAIMDDPLQNDIVFLRFAKSVSDRVLESLPGMKPVYRQLARELLAVRQKRSLPAREAAIEASIQALLGGPEPGGNAQEIWRAITTPELDISHIRASTGYKTFLPVALWGEVVLSVREKRHRRQPQEQSSSESAETPDNRTRKAKRRKSDQIDNKNSLILHRFESILSWAEMMNIPRAVEDDDEDNARKAAEDQEEIGLANTGKKASTKLKFDLDLAPQDVEHERLSAKYVYPEWDYRKNIYYPDHCRVLAGLAPELEEGSSWQPGKAARRRIRAVKRQFEALQPKRERFFRQIDGNEIDMDALIRARCDLAA